MYVCMHVGVYLGQGPLEDPHLLWCLAEDQIGSDLEGFRETEVKV